MVQCSDGGFALVGYTYSYGAGYYDVYVIRTDANGTMLWNQTYGGANYDYGRDIVITDNGFVIVGYSNSFSASHDLWLIGIDQNGNHLWNITYGSTSSDYTRAIIATSDGGYAITGYTYGFGASESDLWLVHTNATGGDLWNTTFDSGWYDTGWDLVECAGGGYAICGRGYTTNYDMWLVRTDASGNHLWNQTYGSTSSESGYSLVECSNGDFALAGETSGYGASSTAAWLVRTDASGNHLWNQTYDEPFDDEAHTVIEYSDGGFILAGETGQIPEARNGGDSDGLLVRTDASGNMLWNRSTGGSYSDRYWDVVEGSNGDLFTGGYADSGSGYDAWLAKTAYPLAFSPALTDQTEPFNAPLTYDINVYSWFGEDTWTLNDTTHFSVSGTGVVTNALVLATGVYGLRVSVNDTLGHEITGEFTVAIEPREFFPVFLPLILLIALIAVIIVILVYYYMSRKD